MTEGSNTRDRKNKLKETGPAALPTSSTKLPTSRIGSNRLLTEADRTRPPVASIESGSFEGHHLNPTRCEIEYQTLTREDNTHHKYHRETLTANEKPKLKPRDRDLDKTQRKRPGLQGFRIGTWNVRTLYKAGALNTLINTIDRYKANIVALQETRWQGEGCIATCNMTLFYGGVTTNRHENGVGFLVHNSLIPWVKQFKAINDRICYIRINMNHRDMIIICAYAPTKSGNKEVKDAFYEELEQVYDTIPSHCIKVLLGDMNAQVGKENTYKTTIGEHSLHDQSNDNGVRLINFAISKNMVVSSTRFPRKNIHKETWLSPGGKYSSQIDHVLIENKHKTIIKNVKSYRGANADTDHYLILIDFRTYQETVTNLLGRREGFDTEQIEESWIAIKTSITESAEKVIQLTQRKKTKKWFNDNCKQVIRERNEARIKAIHTPTPENIRDFENKRREVNTLIRKEKRIAEKERLEDIENLKHNPREFFKRCKTFKNGFVPNIRMIEDNNGTLITKPENIAEEFRSYFEKILNRDSTTGIGEQDDTLYYTAEPEVPSPSLEEIQYAIQTLKNNKSPGDDKIAAELLKLGGQNLTKNLNDLIQQIWIKEKIPKEWNESLICPIFKKGNRNKVENYRGITLLNSGYKILSLIILKRLQVYTDEIVGDYQSGFRKNKSTTDHIFVLRQVMERSYE
ncbi:uncharacterized protein LOC111027411 [Myzus persicae]|uniref:uncharacterized protein LOC111027411 n=1 Tax=Myzus persicae TaxID=13164 RepID=UPI000B9341D9|nr:uncharacterized protein LOC111027411 [Myzus persicae]